MIQCPECGKEVYGKAKSCPHCGRPNPGYAAKGLGQALPTWLWLSLVILLIVIGIGVMPTILRMMD